MTLATAQAVGLQYRTSRFPGRGVRADRERREFERYMLALGVAWKIERRAPLRDSGQKERPVAVFACGCSVQVRAYPVYESLPVFCAKHGGKA